MMLRWSVCCRLRRYDRLCQDAFLLLAFQPFEQTRCRRYASFAGLKSFPSLSLLEVCPSVVMVAVWLCSRAMLEAGHAPSTRTIGCGCVDYYRPC
jgi:hypothetical protein